MAGTAATLNGERIYQQAREAMFSDAELNRQLMRIVREVRRKLEDKARVTGYYPRTIAEFDKVMPAGFPACPWGGHQEVMIAATPQMIAAAELRGVDYKILGNGQTERTIARPTTFGAICYRGDGRSFALYGVGKIKKWAVLVAHEYGSKD